MDEHVPLKGGLLSAIQKGAADKSKVWRVLYILGLIACIFFTFYRYIDVSHGGAIITYFLYPLSICIMSLLLFTCDYAKYIEIKFLGAFIVWTILVALLHYGDSDTLLGGWFQSVVITSFLCFSAAYAFQASTQKKLVSIFAVATITPAFLLSILALILVALNRKFTLSNVEGVLGFGEEGRLELFCHANISAAMCGLSLLLSLYLLLVHKKKVVRIVTPVLILVFYIALSLTDSRTGIISTAIAVALFFLFFGKESIRKKKMFLRVFLCVLIALAVPVCFYFGTALVRVAYNATLANSGTVQNEAPVSEQSEPYQADASQSPSPADSPEILTDESQTVSSRDLSDAGTFNGRTGIWLGTLRGLLENPKILITGTTPPQAGIKMTPYFPESAPKYNFHNSYVAALVSYGAVGFLFIAAFLLALAVKCVKLLFGKRATSDHEMLFLPVILFFTVLEGMMEQFLFVDSMPTIIWVWLMFAAGIVFRRSHA